MKRILTTSALAVLLLTACTGLRTRTYQDNLEMPLAENSADSLFFDISLEYAVGGRGMSHEAPDAINAVIGVQAFDLEQMEAIPKQELESLFPDFHPFAGQCRFPDCSHRKEPDCGVLAAVSRGEISFSRHKSYLRLYEAAMQLKPWEQKTNP